jgi:NADH:ubiquinone oxidoreductase subunit E
LQKQDIDDVVAQFPRRKDSLIPILQQAQEKLGYLPKEAFEKIAAHLRVSPNEAFGVATFYSQFRLTPRGRNTVKVCRGTACHVRGGASICKEVERTLDLIPGETSPDLEYTYETVACLGACAMAPVMVTNERIHGEMTPQKARQILDRLNSDLIA